MVATATISESNGAAPTPTVTDSVSNINFGSHDATGLNVANYPITAGQNSFVKYIRMHFVNSFNRIDNLKVWATSSAPATDTAIYFDTVQSSMYATPSAESFEGTIIPTSEPESANVGIAGNLSGSLTEAGYSDYIMLQLRTQQSTPAGSVTTVTFTFQYDEQ